MQQDVVPASHERWLQAEKAAHRAETQLHDAWVAFFFHGGPAPGGTLQRRTALLRGAAQVALAQAKSERLTSERSGLLPVAAA